MTPSQKTWSPLALQQPKVSHGKPWAKVTPGTHLSVNQPYRWAELNASNGTKSMSISSLETAHDWGALPQIQQKPPERALGFTSCFFLSALSLGWWERLILLWDLPWGKCCEGRGIKSVEEAVAAPKPVGWERAAGGAEEHPQVSQMQSGVKLLSHNPWSPHMQHCCLLTKTKTFWHSYVPFPLVTAE